MDLLKYLIPNGVIDSSKEATKASEQYEGAFNGPADAYRHALGAALLSKKYGRPLANMMTTGYEWLTYPSYPVKDSYRMDIHNNTLGFDLADKYKTRKEIEDQLKMLMNNSDSTYWNQWNQNYPVWLPNKRYDY